MTSVSTIHLDLLPASANARPDSPPSKAPSKGIPEGSAPKGTPPGPYGIRRRRSMSGTLPRTVSA